MAGKVLARHGSAVPHSALPYNERLDGIRAIAIGFVVFAHYFPSLNHLAPFAPLGVRIFFVLSGYLITRILLDARADSELLRGDELKFALLSFYARRALRIMPVYFMGVFTAIVIFGEASEPWASISLLTFTSNWWMVVNNEGLGLASPYWSVAVEEQFYLIWPLIILVLPRSAIFPAVLATVFFGIMWRLVVGMSGMPEFYGSIATFSAIDALGAGALVACLMRRGLVAQTKALGALGLALALPILAADYAASATKTELPAGFRFLTYSAYVGAGVWLLVYALCHCNGGVGRLLGIRPVVWVGKRSYGIYAYHMLFYGAASLILGAFGHDGGSFKGLRQLCALIVTMLVADFSFRHIELPILSLRRYFPYSRGSI